MAFSPRLVVTLTRFSSAVGYGYMSQAVLDDGRGPSLLISCKVLHCIYGDPSGLQSWQKEIKPETMGALSAFCKAGDAGLNGRRIIREISSLKYHALRRAFLEF